MMRFSPLQFGPLAAMAEDIARHTDKEDLSAKDSTLIADTLAPDPKAHAVAMTFAEPVAPKSPQSDAAP